MDRNKDLNIRLTESEQRTLALFSRYTGRTMSEIVRSYAFTQIGFAYQAAREDLGIDIFEDAEREPA